MNSRSPSAARRRWKRWLRRLHPQLADLLVGDHIYHRMRDIVQANPDIRQPGTLHGWMVNNYVDATAIGIRRMCDRDGRSLSMWRLVSDIKANNTILTRASYVHAFPPEGKDAGHEQFDRWASSGAMFMPKSIPSRDLADLEKSEALIRTLVNKRIAHLERSTRQRRWPYFKDLGESIALMEKLFIKYQLIVTRSHQDTLLPSDVTRNEWERVLGRAWLGDGA